MPADLGDESADRPLARRHRRAGGDLFASDDEQRICLRKRAHHRARSGIRRHADRAQAHRQRQARHRAVELLRLRRHQRHAGIQAAGCVGFFLSCPAKAGHPVRRGLRQKAQTPEVTGSPAFAGDDVSGMRERKGMQDLMKGKRGLIMGIANDHSIAWGIAKAVAAQGAELAFTYQGDALGKRVRPLAEQLGVPLVLPCDVEDIDSVAQVFARLRVNWGRLDFLVPPNAISAGPVRTLAGSGIGDARAMFAFQQKHSPLGRAVTLDELGGSSLYLLSELSGGVTGEIHYVDSGYNIISMPRPEDLNNAAE